MKKIEKMLVLQKFWQIRDPCGLMNIYHLLNENFETSQAKTTKALSLLRF